MTTRLQEITRQLDPNEPMPQKHIRAKFKCSHLMAKKAYEAMGWKSQTELKHEEMQKKIEQIAKDLPKYEGMPKSQIAERLHVGDEVVIKAFKLAGIDLPKHNKNGTKGIWPQQFDSMNGMDSLNLLKRAWV